MFANNVASEPAGKSVSHICYSRDFLLQHSSYSRDSKKPDANIPVEIKRQCFYDGHKRERGKKGGVRQKRRGRKTKVPLPTIIFLNVQSIKGKWTSFEQTLATCTNIGKLVSSLFVKPGLARLCWTLTFVHQFPTNLDTRKKWMQRLQGRNGWSLQ